ncbi:MAG: hypothetical protein AB7U61_09590 [Methylocystis sp.]
MTGMITRVGDRKFILQGRADPEAAYDAVGIEGARGSETVREILAWADEHLTCDERQVLSEELSGVAAMKTKKVLDFLAARLTPQELAAVAKEREAGRRGEAVARSPPEEGDGRRLD